MVALLLIGSTAAHAQIYELPRPATDSLSAFGVSVAIDGERAIVGASGEDVCGPNSGAAYVFERNAATGTWRQTARLTPSDCERDAFFGQALDLRGDRAIVSASSEFFARKKSNAAYVYEYDPAADAWTEEARLISTTNVEEGAFAADVAIDRNRAVVTTSGSAEGTFGGAAYVFERDPSAPNWIQRARIAPDAGTLHGVFGGPVALDGDRIAVAASTYLARAPGSVYLFERDASGTWTQVNRLGGIDDFFISVDLSGERLLVGETVAGDDDEGAASLYHRGPSGRWAQAATLRSATPYESGAFGSAVSLGGRRALVTGYDEQLGQDYNIDRVVYVFERDAEDGTWRQRQVVDIGQVDFGTAIDHDGAYAIISSVPNERPGAAYIVQLF